MTTEALSVLSELRNFFIAPDLVIPAVQVASCVATINLLVLFGGYRACFMASLAFALYWLFILNHAAFVTGDGSLRGCILPYVGIVLFFLLLLGISFLTHGER